MPAIVSSARRSNYALARECAPGGASVCPVFWIFCLWLIVLVTVFLRRTRLSIVLGILALVATLVFLKLNMDSTIQLNF